MHSPLSPPELLLKCGPRKLTVLLLLTRLLIMPATASDLVFLRTTAQFEAEPQFTGQSEDGTPSVSGMCADLYRAIERMEPGLRLVSDQSMVPAGRLESALMHGEVDVACALPKAEENEAAPTVIGPSLFAARFHLVARADDPVNIGNWDDVRKLGEDGVILSLQGFGAVKRLRAVGGLLIDHGASDAIGNVRKLHAKRARFFFCPEPSISNIIRNAGFEDKVRVLPKVMDVQPVYLAVSRKLSADVVAKLSRAVNKLNETGELSRLSEKWHVRQ